jgi:hypothetical protein
VIHTHRSNQQAAKGALRPLWGYASAIVGVAILSSAVLAETPSLSSNTTVSLPQQPEVFGTSSSQSSSGAPPAASSSSDHPLTPVLRWAQQGLPAIENLKDYSATLVRRERIRGELTGYEYLFIKIRHKPFSVYVYFQTPASAKGQEAIYVAGHNQGNLLAHQARISATFSLHPDGMVAMAGRRYPVTEIGLVNLVQRLVEVGRQDLKFGECEVNYYKNAKVGKRSCTVIQVKHPTRRDVFRFHLARIFVDDELKVPVRYESYDWPREPGGEPQLIEEYTYLDLKVNNGFTDEDFSTENPQYRFR